MAAIFTTAVFLLFLSGCKKVLDYIIARPGGIAKNCRIERITSNRTFECTDMPRVDTARFSYNAHGDPVSIKFSLSSKLEGCYDYPNDRSFKYDHKNRLIVFLEQGGDSWIENKVYALFWHKYTYENSNLIVDSIFEYAQGDWRISDRPEYYDRTIVTTFELDNYGRIVREVGGSFDVDKTYAYDSNGNLVKPGVTYNNKINIRQTNRVWMFLDRDYSINSPVGAASTFHSSGLPVELNEMPHFLYGFVSDFKNIVVSYKCKQ